MISVVLPYWKRAECAKQCFKWYDLHYTGIEVILVDDGSHDIDIEYPWLRIIRLPKKDIPMNPCVPINLGVAESNGDIIVLSGPDIHHPVPVLEPMREELERLGENGVVCAATWYVDEKRWHCHSSVKHLGLPHGVGLHFCQMFYRTLWDKAGGFDEDYRIGSHYEDNDWCKTLLKAGAVFKIRDDLVVEHTRVGADITWPSGIEKNERLFVSKWQCDVRS